MLIRQKILVVGPYPIIQPRHGGQKRVKAIVEYYRSIQQQTMYVGIFSPAMYPVYDSTDITISSDKVLGLIHDNPEYIDITIGRALRLDKDVYKKFKESLIYFNPDIIHIEQPYLYKSIKALLRTLDAIQPVLIYGSQNIEYKLKQGSLESKINSKLVSQTKSIESYATNSADIVLAVSGDDATILKHEMGAKRRVIVPNGSDPIASTEASTGHWRNIKKQYGIKKIALFVGSGHPPNIKGLEDILANGLNLNNDEKLIIAGGVAKYFFKKYPDKNHSFWKNVIGYDSLEETSLQGLLATCNLVILPIFNGGGSNLKTAEALLANKKILATRFAFRGYEKYLSLPNIHIKDSPDDFGAAISETLKQKYQQRSKRDVRRVSGVAWSSALRPLFSVLLLSYGIRLWRQLKKLLSNYFVNN